MNGCLNTKREPSDKPYIKRAACCVEPFRFSECSQTVRVSSGQIEIKTSLDPCLAVWAVFSLCHRLHKNPVKFFKNNLRGCYNLSQPRSFSIAYPPTRLSHVIQHLCDLKIKKQCRGRKKVLMATPCTLRLLFFYLGLYFLCSTMCAMPFFTSVLYRLFLLN